jgi:hypothetical protein
MILWPLRGEGDYKPLVAVRIYDPRSRAIPILLADSQPFLNNLLAKVGASIVNLTTVVVVNKYRLGAGEHIVRVAATGDYATSWMASSATSVGLAAPKNHDHRS